jgi:hypothetical protein
MNRKVTVRFGAGEKLAITSKAYLWLSSPGFSGQGTPHIKAYSQGCGIEKALILLEKYIL